MSSTSSKNSRAKAVARTAGAATLAVAALAAITSAGGQSTAEIEPAAHSHAIAQATAHPTAAPIAGAVPAPALPPLPPLPPQIQQLLPPPPPPPAPVYADNLDGWIHHALDVMAANHIPGSYSGIYRNVMRESGGNPRAINLYDSNAAAGIPSKGLLQVIDPTFRAFHVNGTSWDIYDPVANITAACNYAASRYGTMDNVDSAY